MTDLIDLQDTLKQLKELADKGGSALFFGWEAQVLLDEREAMRKALETILAQPGLYMHTDSRLRTKAHAALAKARL